MTVSELLISTHSNIPYPEVHLPVPTCSLFTGQGLPWPGISQGLHHLPPSLAYQFRACIVLEVLPPGQAVATGVRLYHGRTETLESRGGGSHCLGTQDCQQLDLEKQVLANQLSDLNRASQSESCSGSPRLPRPLTPPPERCADQAAEDQAAQITARHQAQKVALATAGQPARPRPALAATWSCRLPVHRRGCRACLRWSGWNASLIFCLQKNHRLLW